jgi:hypothetical protein
VPVLRERDDRRDAHGWVLQLIIWGIATLVIAGSGCKKPVDPGPDLQIVGETLRLRPTDPVPRTSPWFDGHTIKLVAARGETLGVQVLHRTAGTSTLALAKTQVHGFAVERVQVVHPSTSMYGGDSRGAGAYPDELVPADAPATNPAYFTIEVPRELAPGHYTGELVVAAQKLPVDLEVVATTLPPLPITAWAEYHPDEIGGTIEQPGAGELACSALFRAHGMLLAPPMNAVAYRARTQQLADSPYVPVDLGTDPVKAASESRAWKGLLAPSQHAFAIPIDEPKAKDRDRVRALAEVVHDANRYLLFAVTDEPRTEYGDTIDLYIPLTAKLTDTYLRWTYNGASPRAGSMVVDAPPPGTRTWGWIAWRYKIAIWYAWDALYWHDRYNHRDQPRRELHARSNATSFDDGDDIGNLDGVLAYPAPNGQDGCHASLRLEALRRGMEDRALLDLASTCDPDRTAALAKQMIPRALGDASGSPAWPSDEAAWEAARQQLLALAACH